MKTNAARLLLFVLLWPVHGAPSSSDFSPKPEEAQLPNKMHSAMKVQPTIRVGVSEGDLIGRDNRALQAAVDYIAGLGGGIVEIGPGEFLMRDSLHVRSHVTVRGTPGKTILKKATGVVSALALDGDYGEEQITVEHAEGFEVGYGVTIWDAHANGFHTTVARITGRNGNTFSIDHSLNADCMVGSKAQAATIFPIVSGCEIEGARIENLIVEGNKQNNPHMDGCRGGGIYLCHAFGTVIQDCTVRNFNGDGISFQQSNDTAVLRCVSENNSSLGLHPGSGSQRPVVRDCVARSNGEDGLFLCWRVRHGLFENNRLEQNGRFGISIGHKDSDNLLRQNQVIANDGAGVFFRDESLGMAGHRNRLENNLIENNGKKADQTGVRIRGETRDLVLKDNVIRDTREAAERSQTTGVRIERNAGPVKFEGNRIEAKVAVEDQRPAESQKQ